MTEQTKSMSLKEILSFQYDLLGHNRGEITEIRFLPSTISYFPTSKEEFIEAAQEAIKEGKTEGENVYVGINPRRTTEPGKSDAIPRLTALVLDVDPVRPKNTASTDEQHGNAINLGRTITKDLGGFLSDSGSGAHVTLGITPIEVTNAEALTDSLRDWFQGIKEKYGTKDLKLDPIFDLPRVIRLWGSHNHKSNRPCLPLQPLVSIPRINLSFNQNPKPKSQIQATGTELEQRFDRLCRSNKRLRDIKDGIVSFPSKSDGDFAFVAELRKAQFSAEEVRALWGHNTNGNEEPKKGDIERIFKKVQPEADTRAFSLANDVSNYFDSLGSRKMGIRTGFTIFDEMVSGLKDGKLYIIGARPTTGKTTLITQVLTNIAEQGIPCLFFPTEVGAEPIIDKIISRKGKIQLKKFQNGTFTEADKAQIGSFKEVLPTLPLTIYDQFGLNIEKLEREIGKYAPKVVVLDYFQALKWNDPKSVGEKEDAVHRIKSIAKDNNIVFICMSQLNRAKETSKADMAELKGTGSLEELGDVIAQMYRVETPTPVYPIPIDLVVTKSKYSAVGTINLQFDNTYCSFVESAVQMT